MKLFSILTLIPLLAPALCAPIPDAEATVYYTCARDPALNAGCVKNNKREAEAAPEPKAIPEPEPEPTVYYSGCNSARDPALNAGCVKNAKREANADLEA
ncbi:hypothetical protein MMC10_006227 [Thelotrema lepadinum]|nr:hypothetical protein [Thelotrema lepadinum]